MLLYGVNEVQAEDIRASYTALAASRILTLAGLSSAFVPSRVKLHMNRIVHVFSLS